MFYKRIWWGRRRDWWMYVDRNSQGSLFRILTLPGYTNNWQGHNVWHTQINFWVSNPSFLRGVSTLEDSLVIFLYYLTPFFFVTSIYLYLLCTYYLSNYLPSYLSNYLPIHLPTIDSSTYYPSTHYPSIYLICLGRFLYLILIWCQRRGHGRMSRSKVFWYLSRFW